eukprot:gnl/TRDRNA2_/TRDRNA2_163819_c0_seq3.p1 gnl/TRDRNA2_/TRDRNA2_163819_c0~~gnl/TRDRNA2_/TRDRNA2_163819_c0_seq3.p1  ORF type:complete len:275 (-),score=43.19 gnl/TRDRNA2_/TRDRNA2_163819_c0_seq3:152-934(-)
MEAEKELQAREQLESMLSAEKMQKGPSSPTSQLADLDSPSVVMAASCASISSSWSTSGSESSSSTEAPAGPIESGNKVRRYSISSENGDDDDASSPSQVQLEEGLNSLHRVRTPCTSKVEKTQALRSLLVEFRRQLVEYEVKIPSTPSTVSSQSEAAMQGTGQATCRVEWESDAPNCTLCGTTFDKRCLKLRHHCRICGKNVCAACSPNQVQLEGQRRLQRACTPCVTVAMRKLQMHSDDASGSEDMNLAKLFFVVRCGC